MSLNINPHIQTMDLHKLPQIALEGVHLLGITTTYEGAAALLQLVGASYVGWEPIQNSPYSGRIFYPEIIGHLELSPAPFIPQKTHVELGKILFDFSLTARRDPAEQPVDMKKGWEVRWAIVGDKMIAIVFAVWVSDKMPVSVPVA